MYNSYENVQMKILKKPLEWLVLTYVLLYTRNIRKEYKEDVNLLYTGVYKIQKKFCLDISGLKW